ncbi:hypothetical protein H8D29_07470 [PVC group bacterium]|nr:hypothetical protein [PVC group bacterium]
MTEQNSRDNKKKQEMNGYLQFALGVGSLIFFSFLVVHKPPQFLSDAIEYIGDDEPQSQFYNRTEICDICGGGGIKFGESSDKWHYQNCPRYSKPTSFDFFPEL